MQKTIENFTKNIAKIEKRERFKAITDVLKQRNINYTVQELNHFASLGNIIVTFNPSNEKKIVVSAHYDNYDKTPGANDNATACAILLNLILEFKNTQKHIEFVFFDLEERGFVGSREYLIKNQNKILYAINLDMCGMGENIVYSENHFDQDESQKLEKLANMHKAKKVKLLPPGDAYNFFHAFEKTLYIINSTNNDLNWFENYYKGIIDYRKCDFLKTMHKENDTIDTVNFEQVLKINQFIRKIIEI